jgi:hypothetical protein
MYTGHPCLDPTPNERPPLAEVTARLAADRWWEAPPPRPDYRLYDFAGRPTICPHCGQADCWQPRAHPADRHVYAFACHHVPCTAVEEPLGSVGTALTAAIAACELVRRP